MKTTVKMPLSVTIIGAAAIMFTTLNSFRLQKQIENFDEINVQRINVVEKDGTIRMVISNKALQHSGRMDGKNWEKRERQAGMIFFNDEGDECGGLVYEAKNQKTGKLSGMSMTMDRYKDDQVLQILNSENINEGKIMSQRGFIVSDFPSNSSVTARNAAIAAAEKIADEKRRKETIRKIYREQGSKGLLFLGKTAGNSQGLFLNDQHGNPKLMVYVNDKGEPKIQTFNEKGEMKDFLIPSDTK